MLFKLHTYSRRAVSFSGGKLDFNEILEGFNNRIPAWELAGLEANPDKDKK